MACGLRKRDNDTAPYYARRCNGYAQTTDSTTCCEGGFCRFKDCCADRYGWFPCQICGGDPTGKVIKFLNACWNYVGPGPLSEQEVHEQFPTERVYTPTGNVPCYDTCADPNCPPCPEDCCFVDDPDDPCPTGQCDCSPRRCVCGRAWTLTVNVTGQSKNVACLFPTGSAVCAFYTYTAHISVSWRYHEVAPGICDLEPTNISGSLVTTQAPGPHCPDVVPNTITTTFDNTYADSFEQLGFIGCGQSPAEVIGCVGSLDQGHYNLCQYPNLPVCGNWAGQCDFDEVSSGGYCHIHGGFNCLGGFLNSDNALICQPSGDISDNCQYQMGYSVFINEACDADPKGGLGPAGGSSTTPPSAGGFF